MPTPNQDHDRLPTEAEIAVRRIQRITQRAASPNAGAYLVPWFKDCLQRWWMSHRHLIDDVEVREAFCDAADACLVHFAYAPELARIVAAGITDLRKGGSGTYAMARFVVIELELDPDATPRSLLAHEWEHSPAATAEDSDRDAAEYLATLTRSTLRMIADPEMYEQERIDLIHIAIAGLRAVADTRQHLNDLWAAVLATLHEYADGNVARMARLHVAVEDMEGIARDPF